MFRFFLQIPANHNTDRCTSMTPQYGEGNSCKLSDQTCMNELVVDSQVLMLRRAIAAGKHGFVVWIDADALVVDQEKPLEAFIAQATNASASWVWGLKQMCVAINGSCKVAG